MAVFIVQGGEQPGQNRGRIRHRAAKDTAVQVHKGTPHGQFQRGDSPQAIGKGWDAFGHHVRVGNGDDVATQVVAFAPQELTQVRTPDLLLALDQKDNVHRQLAVFGDLLGNPEDVRKMLSFVVGGTPRVNPALRNAGLEGIGLPKRDRIDGLDIVVPVNHDGGTTLTVRIPRGDDGVTGRFVFLGDEAAGAKFVHEPIRARPHLRSVGGIG